MSFLTQNRIRRKVELLPVEKYCVLGIQLVEFCKIKTHFSDRFGLRSRGPSFRSHVGRNSDTCYRSKHAVGVPPEPSLSIRRQTKSQCTSLSWHVSTLNSAVLPRRAIPLQCGRGWLQFLGHMVFSVFLMACAPQLKNYRFVSP